MNLRIILFYWINFRCVCVSEGRVANSVFFQTSNVATMNSFLDGGIGAFTNITQFTICLRFQLVQKTESQVFASYFAETDFDNELILELRSDNNLLAFGCCQNSIFATYPLGNLHLLHWYSFCVAVDTTLRNISFVSDYLERELTLPEDGKKTFLLGGGRLVLGQDLDTIEGGFNVAQAFYGEISEFSMYQEKVDVQLLKSFVNSSVGYFDIKSIYKFENILDDFELIGEVALKDISSEEFSKEHKYETLITKKVTFSEANACCETLKGNIMYPTNALDYNQTYNKYIDFENLCLGQWSTFFWLGYKGNKETGEWVTIPDGDPLNSEQIELFHITLSSATSYPCVTAGGTLFPLKYFSSPCENITCCTICRFTEPTYLKLRGLCKETLIDKFWVFQDYYKFYPIIYGTFYSKILWNSSSMILSSRRYEIQGKSTLEKGQYPWGRRFWDIEGDECTYDKQSAKVRLLLTSCYDNELTCSDTGQCFPRSARCDGIYDCKDHSDELFCDVVVIGDGYSASRLPRASLSQAFPILLMVNITTVRQLNLVGFELHIDVYLSLKWRDRGVSYKNLKRGERANNINNMTMIWTPEIMVEDSNRSPVDINSKMKSLHVQKESMKLEADDAYDLDDDLYSGENNTLFLLEMTSMRFTCQFNLILYPFDVQMCFMVFTLKGYAEEVQIKQDYPGLIYEGQRNLLEYQVIKEIMEPINYRNTKAQKVTLVFKNQYGYYLGNTVLPSLLLLLISYSVFFYDINDFQNRIMVSLTSLLVLTSLFSQTSQSIPKTSYLKLVDVWFIVLIVFNFMVIVSLVKIEYHRLHENQLKFNIQTIGKSHSEFSQNKKLAWQDVNKDRKNPKKVEISLKLNKIARKIIPVIMITVLLAFGSIAFNSMQVN